jgi:large subunit ribosomal protein L23
MKLFDFFKRKKKQVEKPKEAEKPLKVKVAKKPKETKKPQKKRSESLAWKALKSPHVSEKATDLVAKNQYTFKILPGTNKIEIKKAVENLYGVDVAKVNIIKIPSKRKRLGKIRGWRKGYKKAIVKLKQGQKIEVLPR